MKKLCIPLAAVMLSVGVFAHANNTQKQMLQDFTNANAAPLGGVVGGILVELGLGIAGSLIAAEIMSAFSGGSGTHWCPYTITDGNGNSITIQQCCGSSDKNKVCELGSIELPNGAVYHQ